MGLNARQNKALAALLRGASITKAAAAAGVHRNTLGRWLNSDAFQAELDKGLAIAVDELVAQWATVARIGPQTVAAILQDKNATHTAKLRAVALGIDALAQLQNRRDIERRLGRLERMLDGQAHT